MDALKSQRVPSNIPYKKNVMILKPEDFADFMGYKDDIYDDFIEAVNLVRILPFIKKGLIS